jgi:hypothetical protein
MTTKDMTVREWLDHNLSGLHDSALSCKIYRRIMASLQFVRTHHLGEASVYESKISIYMNDENYPQEKG